MARDDLLGRQVGEELPHRLAFALRPQVPHGVDQRAGGHVQDALLGAEPAELFVDGEVAVEAAQVVDDLVEAAADDVMLERVDGGRRRSRCRGRW